jgi:hypothetical protein
VQQPFQVIPTEVFEAWTKGEYYVGDIPSISYTRLGTALYLRGWYTYENEPGSEKTLSGVAKIDIRGAFLSMGGIRLLQQDKRAAVFWKTEASHFVGDDEVLWFYTVLNANIDATLLAAYLPHWWLKEDMPTPRTRHYGLNDDEWGILLDRLRTGFDLDAERIQQQCSPAQIDHGMIRFDIKPHADAHRSEYYQFYFDGSTRDLIKGVALFKRASKA